MNQMFIVCCLVSAITAIALFKRVGSWWSLTIVLALPILMFVIAVILLLVGGDR